MNNNNKLQNSYVYIILGLLSATFIAAVYIACRCYTPYSYKSMISNDLKPVLWTFMLLPSVILPIALWLANMLKPTLSRFSLLSVLLTCCFFVAVPRLYKLGDVHDMALLTSAFTFFLICCTLCAIIRDLKKKELKQWLNIVFGIILTVVFLLLSGYVSYFILNIDYFDWVMLSFIAPVLCAVVVAGSIFDVYSKATLILNISAVGYATLCVSFEKFLNDSRLMLVFIGLSALAVIWQIIDIIKYIFQRRNKNDSESCNA